MATLALALSVLYFALAFGARAFLHLRRTGPTGFETLGEAREEGTEDG